MNEVAEIMDYHQLSSYLGRSSSALRHDVSRGRIPHLKLGEGKHAQVKFRKKDIDAWLESLMTPARIVRSEI